MWTMFMPPVNNMFSSASTRCSLRAETSPRDHQRMVDRATFSERFDEALAACGTTNARVAATILHGQQKIRNWRNRGAITATGFREIRHLLPGVSFEWLNDGVGPPPRSAAVSDSRAEYQIDPSAVIERMRSDIQSLQQVIGLLTLALVHNVPDAVERVAEELRLEQHDLPIDQNFLGKFLKRVDNALAARRETVGPQHPESIQTSGASPRP